MGTNYYLHEKPACPTCGHCADEPLHIGKSSGGWTFALHAIPEEGLHTLEDWIDRWSKPGAWIRNEYEEGITPEKMLSVITERKSIRPPDDPTAWVSTFYANEYEFHAKNGSMRGPNGLARRVIRPGYCIGHGEGTWDYIVGEFS